MDEQQMVETLRKNSEKTTLEVVFTNEGVGFPFTSYNEAKWLIYKGNIFTIGNDGLPVNYWNRGGEIQFLSVRKGIPFGGIIEIRVNEVGESLTLEELSLFLEAESLDDLQN